MTVLSLTLSAQLNFRIKVDTNQFAHMWNAEVLTVVDLLIHTWLPPSCNLALFTLCPHLMNRAKLLSRSAWARRLELGRSVAALACSRYTNANMSLLACCYVKGNRCVNFRLVFTRLTHISTFYDTLVDARCITSPNIHLCRDTVRGLPTCSAG